MNIANLSSLVADLPATSVDKRLTIESPDDCFNFEPSLRAGYVWPDVEFTSSDASPIVLITAPGAGGKTISAEAIASTLHAPLIDLAKLQVGSDTLLGLLARVLGWTQAASFIADLGSGKQSIVLDSLDEAQILAGRENFSAFLRSIASMMSGANPVGQLVLLGRREAIRSAKATFLELGTPVRQLAIRPLTHQQGCELVNLALDMHEDENGVKDYAVHRTHPVPFGRFRDSVFKEIAQALGASSEYISHFWPEVESFLGYPPVLQVLAESFARVVNPEGSDARAVFGASAKRDKTAQGSLLRKIVERLLDRESKKVQVQVAKILELSDVRTDLLYLREEQALRVIAASADYPIEIASPAFLNDAEKAVYVEQIKGFVSEHPFLAVDTFSNIVFSDYIRAFVATSQTVELSELNRAELLSLIPQPGPFFAQFVYALTNDVAGESPEGALVGVVEEAIVDDLIKSHMAGGSPNSAATYSHLGESASLTLSEVDPARQEVYSIAFDISNPVGILELSSPVTKCVVVTDQNVVLSSVNGEVEIGPHCIVIANELQIIGKRLTAAASEMSNILLIARGGVDHDPDLKVSAYPDNTLKIAWDSPWYQWRKYVVNYPETGPYVSPGVSYQILVWARRILTSFRASMKSGPSIFKELLDNHIVGGNVYIAATLKGLIELGVIRDEGSLYRLNLDELSKYEVNWAGITGPNYVNALDSLRKALIRTESVLSVSSRPA